jgi:outer membrane lipoprotein-sorting protein
MNKKLFFVIGILAAGTALFAQDAPRSVDADAIIRASRNRIQAETISTRSRMVLTAKNGATTERVIDQYSKDGPKGDRVIIVFQSPKSVAGTRFLTMENPGSPDDRWIFLPELGKVRRIAASEGSGSFMGTDLSYDDVSSATRSAELDTHTFLREDTLAGIPCYVIQSVPKDSSYQYSKMIQWIGKDTKVSYKIELYDRKAVQVKTLEILDLKDVQGRLTPMVTRMTTIGAGTSTVINVDKIEYDKNIPESVFTTSYLETGKAR